MLRCRFLCHVLRALFFIKIALKLSYFAKKCKILQKKFRGALPPDPHSEFLATRLSGRVDRASATETVDLGSIPSRVKPKTIKIGIHSFPV